MLLLIFLQTLKVIQPLATLLDLTCCLQVMGTSHDWSQIGPDGVVEACAVLVDMVLVVGTGLQ